MAMGMRSLRILPPGEKVLVSVLVSVVDQELRLLFSLVLVRFVRLGCNIFEGFRDFVSLIWLVGRK
jgi:hypothetical protein